jgi:hypothetical protein
LNQQHTTPNFRQDFIYLRNINNLCRVSGFTKPEAADKKTLFCSLIEHLATKIRNKSALFEIGTHFNRIYLKNEFESKF